MNREQAHREILENRVRLFGLPASLAQATRAVFRPIINVKRDIVVAVVAHDPKNHILHNDVHTITPEAIEEATKHGELNERQRRQLMGFLADGCAGFMGKIEGRLAGYGFVQFSGVYKFGYDGQFPIPPGMAVLKNLLIFPDYRGRSLGKRLHEARLSAIPEGYVPLGFVIPENRYNMRNLKMIGFEEMVVVTRRTWLKRWTVQRINVIRDCDISRRIVHQLMNGHSRAETEK